jgi:hypothetical protein
LTAKAVPFELGAVTESAPIISPALAKLQQANARLTKVAYKNLNFIIIPF